MIIQSVYSSELTVDSPAYYRDPEMPKYHYTAFQLSVFTNGTYVLWSESNINTYGYIYKNDFNSRKPSENLLLQHDGYCNDGQFKFIIDLEIDTRYVLVVTTHRPQITGNFSIFMSGPNNITLNPWRASTSNVGTAINSNALLYICLFFVCWNELHKKYIN